MICDAEDIKRLIEAALSHHDRIHDSFSEAQVIALEEIIRRVVRKMDAEDFWDHSHDKEGNME